MTRQFEFDFDGNVVKLTVARQPRSRCARPATVLAFPIERDAQRVDAAARKILRLPSELARERYWKPMIQRMRRNLLKMGVDADAVETTLENFRDAVQYALDDLCDPRRTQPREGGR